MPRDTISLPDLDHEVYEDLPDFIKEALADPYTQDVCFDPGGVVRVHAHGGFKIIGTFDASSRVRFLRKIAEVNTRYFENRHPILRATSPRKERVEAVFENVSIDGVAFVMRVPGVLMTLDDWLDRGSITADQKAAVEEHAGTTPIVVAGTAGTGKTTFLRAILESPRIKGTAQQPGMRWVSIEADPEVQRPENGVRLIEVEPEPDMLAINFMRLLRSALRLLPEIIVISEVLTGEQAFAFVHACRGHIGASTIHARRPILAPRAVQELGKMVGGIPTADVAEACSVVVQVEKTPDGGRRVREIVTIGVDQNEFVATRIA